MENIVEKVILATEDKKIKGISVVYDDKIEFYGFGKDNINNVIDNQYSNAVLNLRKQYSRALKGLSDQEAIDKLVKMGVIEIVNHSLISKVTCYENPSKFVVEYAGEKSKEFKLEDFYDEEEYNDTLISFLNKMALQFDISENDFDTLKDMKLFKEANTISDVLKENKISNFIVRNKKLLSGILIGAIAVTGISIGSSLIKKSKKDNSSNKEIYELVDDNNIYYGNSYIYGEESVFPYYEYPNDDSVVEKVIDGGTYYYNEFDNYLYLHDIRNNDMSNIGNKVQSNIPLDGKGTLIYYENTIPYLSLEERTYVRYFSMLGNEITKCAYADANYDGDYGVKHYSSLSGFETLRLIRDDVPLLMYINGEEKLISFSSLSKDAQTIVLNIAWANNLPLYKSEIKYNDELYNQDDISDTILIKSEEINMVR